MYRLIAQKIKLSKRLVFFTGAGASTESGIPDFKSNSGLYSSLYKNKYRPEEILSSSFFYKNPDIFYEYYREKLNFDSIKPNYTHEFISDIEKMGYIVHVITQNIDSLHEIANNHNIYKLHGSLERNHCIKCNKYFDVSYVLRLEGVPYCNECNGLIKPDVTLYEEPLDSSVTDQAINAITKSDMLFIIGTSLSVYPAAGFIDYFKGDSLVLINKTKTRLDNKADFLINESSSLALGEIMDCLKEI